MILAEMPAVEEVDSAASYAAAAGVQPTSKKSGLRQPESAPMSRGGRRRVRQMLFLPILAARKKIPELGEFYDRLKLKGKKHRQVMVACVRKLLMIIYGVLKHRSRFKSRLPGNAIEVLT